MVTGVGCLQKNCKYLKELGRVDNGIIIAIAGWLTQNFFVLTRLTTKT